MDTANIHELLEIKEKAYILCKEYLHGVWNTIQPNEIEVKKISGGLSNLLYLCALPEGLKPSNEGEPSQVLLRLYGQIRGESEEALEGLLTESVIFTLLSESQRGPRLLGVFHGGRLEEYIPARPLLTKELGDKSLSSKIAVKLGQIHSMKVPLNKHPRWLWNTMQRWLDNIQEVRTLSSTEDSKMFDKFLKYDLEKEFIWLKRELPKIDSPVVFCHNDLQEGNILLRENGEVVVIDFEYSAYNYRGFDFANHLCERMYDYSCREPPYFTYNPNDYPNVEQQEEFTRTYLKSLGSVPVKEDIDQIFKEIRAFTLASHFFWALWSVVNGAVSKIPFDYWVYGEARFQSYFQHKKYLISIKEFLE